MYPPGHVGIALALYAPIGLVLLLRGHTRLAVAGTAVVAGATLLPDVDSSLPWLVHRGRTHTLWFALAVGASLGAVGALVGGVRRRGGDEVIDFAAFGFVVGTVAILAHLLGDVVTPMGVRPLFPLSETGHTFSLVLASDPTANARLFALGCLATVVQFAVGVGFAPGSRGRSAVGEVLRLYVGSAGAGPRSTPEKPPGLPEAAAGHVDSSGRTVETDD